MVKVLQTQIEYNQKHGMGNNTIMYKQRKDELIKKIKEEESKIAKRKVVRAKWLSEMRGEL